MHTFTVIADDFTGANDTGVQVCKRGIPIDVILDAHHIENNSASLSVDTESRVLCAGEAYDRVAAVMRRVLETGGCQHLYKKIDSTLRGNIQAELQALVDVYKPQTVIFAPAYPVQGRTVEQGRLCVDGQPLLTTEIAKDPRNPLREDCLPALLQSCGIRVSRHYSIADIETENLIFGEGVYTFDAVTDQHLEGIARHAAALPERILWIGSAGLAEGLLNAVCPVKPAMAVVGSISLKTMEQIAYCRGKGVAIVHTDMIQAYEQRQVQESVKKAAAYLENGRDILLTAAESRQDYERFAAYGGQRGISTDRLAEFTKQTLSRMVLPVLGQAKTAGIFLTGGDTAIAVIECLRSRGSHIEQELLPGFVQGRLNGGPYDGLPIVTKAGAFGSAADIYACMQKIKALPDSK